MHSGTHMYTYTCKHAENQEYDERHWGPQAVSSAPLWRRVAYVQGCSVRWTLKMGVVKVLHPHQWDPCSLLPEGAGHRDSAMPRQYLLLLHLQAAWLHPEDPPGLHSFVEGPGRSPSLLWSHWPAPGSGQPGAGCAAYVLQGSESGQGRAEVTHAGVSPGQGVGMPLPVYLYFFWRLLYTKRIVGVLQI